MQKSDAHIFSGMQRDMSVSKQKPEFLWDAHNIRLTPMQGDTMFSVTNEKGTAPINDVNFTGTYLGHCVMGNYLVVFTTNNSPNKKDYIYRVNKSDNYKLDILYEGNLGFNESHPIETLGFYENELVQKVYWVDGINQPRVINIVKEHLLSSSTSEVKKLYNDYSFDFVRELSLNETIYVDRQPSSSGQFQSGVIQYALTYYDKYGQESNIAYVTPLHYITPNDRGGSPEEKVGVSFKITIKNPDTNFEYARLYSIYRSSLNGTPIVKRVTDIPVSVKANRRGAGAVDPKLNYYRATGYPLVTGVMVGGLEYKKVPIDYFSTQLLNYVKEGNGMDAAPGNYYDFSTEDFEEISINVDNRLITWGENAEHLFVSEGPILGGPGDISKRLITCGLEKDSGYLNISITDEEEVVDPDDDEEDDGEEMGGSTGNGSESTKEIFFIDDGTQGEAIDPTALLYVGGETVTASTLAQKDGTLFLGDIRIIRPTVNVSPNKIDNSVNSTREVKLSNNTGEYYSYQSLLTAKDNEGHLVNPTGFKRGERYRFGIQLQHKSGKWSDPIFLKDDTITNSPSIEGNTLSISKYSLHIDLKDVPSDYKRVRGVVVLPTIADRAIVAQGVATPTVFNLSSRADGFPYAQSSWFFRPGITGLDNDTNRGDNALDGSIVEFRDGFILSRHGDRGAEIQGNPETIWVKYSTGGSDTWGAGGLGFPVGAVPGEIFDEEFWTEATSIFAVDRSILTFHSPDIEFDDSFDALDLSNLSFRRVGDIVFESNFGDINIQTSSPTIHPNGKGFIHKTVRSSLRNRILAAGLYYSDYLVDDADGEFKAYESQNYDYLFMVYPWQKSGSINNDAIRPADKGTRSSVLSKKKISNLRFSKSTTWISNDDQIYNYLVTSDIKLFNSDQVSILKLNGDKTYYGNIDTIISPIKNYSVVFSTGASVNDDGTTFKYHSAHPKNDVPTITDSKYAFLHIDYSPNFGNSDSTSLSKPTMKKRTKDSLLPSPMVIDDKDGGTDIGDNQGNLAVSKEGIRMKYKSTKHIVFSLKEGIDGNRVALSPTEGLPIMELYRTINPNTMFGGTSDEAKMSNIWLPAGEPVPINRGKDSNGNNSKTVVDYIYGDTWYQRYDCLKTYPFTLEDENSIVEIASFLVESRMNIDGRYDKNRGQSSNLTMTPTNFNLFNPVYTQPNNFFSYRILDGDYYKLNNFQNSITWSLNKQPAAVVDTWTKVSLANILDLDGNMGAVTSLSTVNDTIYCFQESGLSQILFNSRVQIPTSDNNPIEITNNYKVDGSRLLSDSIGVKNKWSIVKSTSGLYFVDSIGNTLYNLSNGLTDVSGTHGFSHWFDQLDSSSPWTPLNHSLKLFYDRNKNDLYVTPSETSLAFSEVLGQFTSFMSYGNTPAMFNIGSDFYAIKDGVLWKLFEGDYNYFFGDYKPFDLTFVSNADSAVDKVFTNLELRADFYEVDELQSSRLFDYIRVWNEYQDTDDVALSFKNAKPSNLKKKFRIWRIDIPRDKTKKLDRIRNTWSYIKLGVYGDSDHATSTRMVLHDISTQYFT